MPRSGSVSSACFCACKRARASRRMRGGRSTPGLKREQQASEGGYLLERGWSIFRETLRVHWICEEFGLEGKRWKLISEFHACKDEIREIDESRVLCGRERREGPMAVGGRGTRKANARNASNYKKSRCETYGK